MRDCLGPGGASIAVAFLGGFFTSGTRAQIWAHLTKCEHCVLYLGTDQRT